MLGAAARGRGRLCSAAFGSVSLSGVLSCVRMRAWRPSQVRVSSCSSSWRRGAGDRGDDPVDRRAAGARGGPLVDVGPAAEDQQLLGARHRDVEQAALLLGVGFELGLVEPLPGGRGDRVAAAERGRAAGRRCRPGPTSSGERVPPALRPRSATHTTGNSSPFARWIVISRTASRPSDSSAASPSRASARSRCCASARKPLRSRPSARSYSPASRISLRRLARRRSPPGRASVARS